MTMHAMYIEKIIIVSGGMLYFVYTFAFISNTLPNCPSPMSLRYVS